MSSLILKSIGRYAFILALPLFFISCGDDASTSGSLKASARMPVPKKAAAKKKAPASKRAVKSVAVSEAGKIVPKKALRNPFQSYIKQKIVKDDRVLGPLECCELNLFRLMAVISNVDRPRALIMAPDGQKYITKKGDVMGLRGGKITKIYKNRILIEESFKDSSGKKMVKEIVEIKLPTFEEKRR